MSSGDQGKPMTELNNADEIKITGLNII